jgi:hypothetical protein
MRKSQLQAQVSPGLIKALLRSSTNPGSQEGFSLPLVIALALMLLIGGLALANRANQGLFSVIFQNQSWDAREAAEIGMNRLISELNKERNRWLMVKREGDGEQIWSNATAGGTVATLRTNPCEPQTGPAYNNLDPNNGASTSSGYGKWYVSDNGSVSSSPAGATRAYRLVGVTRQTLNSADQLSPFRDRTATPSGVGSITLQVQGQALRSDGSPAATVTLEKTFELTPKCCKSSFGGAHGALNYALDADNNSLCTRDLLGLGLLAGAAQNNTGSITLRGRATDIEGDTGEPVDPLYCIASNLAGCAIDENAAEINVAIIDSELPSPKIYPTEPSPIPGSINTSNINTYQTNKFLYKLDKDQFVVNGSFTDPSSLPNFCTYDNFINPDFQTLENATEIHCNIRSFSYKNSKLIFVTGVSPAILAPSSIRARKIRFYFPESGSIIESSGNGTLLHCQQPDAGENILDLDNECTRKTSGSQITYLSLFGCGSCGTQSVTLRGTGGTLKLFSYFPQGNIDLYGNSSFEGVLWSNAVSSTGNPTWTVPGSGVGSVFEYMDMLPSSDGGSASNSLIAYDFVARATNRYRWR